MTTAGHAAPSAPGTTDPAGRSPAGAPAPGNPGIPDGGPISRRRPHDLARRRWPAALGVVAAAVFFGDGADPLPAFAWILAAMPVAYLVFGVAHGELRRPDRLAVQVAGLLAFAGVAAAVLAVGGDPARYLLAAGWAAHGLWDLAHYRTGRVVPRPWAEWCGVVDVLGAAAIALLPAAG